MYPPKKTFNGKSQFLIGDTSSNVCFSIAMSVFWGVDNVPNRFDMKCFCPEGLIKLAIILDISIYCQVGNISSKVEIFGIQIAVLIYQFEQWFYRYYYFRKFVFFLSNIFLHLNDRTINRLKIRINRNDQYFFTFNAK